MSEHDEDAAQRWAAANGLMLVPAWFADMVEDTQPLRAAINREQKRLARLAASTD